MSDHKSVDTNLEINPPKETTTVKQMVDNLGNVVGSMRNAVERQIVEPVTIKNDRGEKISLSFEDVKSFICEGANNKEIKFFMELCRARNLNPFIGEAYMVKYGGSDASLIVGKDVFIKRAKRQPSFKGFQAGIILKDKDGKIERREGAFYEKHETVVGGWAKVFTDKFDQPFLTEVSFEEYAGRKKDGNLNRNWAGKPGTMIRKVALVHALREAYPDEFGGMYDESERDAMQGDKEIPVYDPDSDYVIQNGEYEGVLISKITDIEYLKKLCENKNVPAHVKKMTESRLEVLGQISVIDKELSKVK